MNLSMTIKEYAMSYSSDHKQKFQDLEHHLKNQDQLRRESNGGNSILFSYPPEEEYLYIKKAKEVFKEKASLIDISSLFVEIIDKDGWDSFKEYYEDFKTSTHLVFKSEDPAPDLFDSIIGNIEQAAQKGLIPILIRTGCLYGTGIENVNIMEHKSIITLPHPLVIFYPSKIVDDNLFFMNIKPASKYRCILVK